MSGEQINRKCWKDNVSEAKLLLTWSSTSLQIPSRPTLGFLHLMALFASMPCQSQQYPASHQIQPGINHRPATENSNSVHPRIRLLLNWMQWKRTEER